MKTLQDPEKVKKVGRIYEKVTDANRDYFHYWKEHTLFHWDFWLTLVVFIFVPIIFWIRFRKKESTNRLLFVGFFVSIISSWLDFIGVQCGLWYYTGKVVPTIPSYVPWDLILIPILIMTLIQIKPTLSPFVKALLFAAISAFIGEPLFLWLGFYVIKKWSIFYSFPIYFVIYLMAHKLSRAGNFEPIK